MGGGGGRGRWFGRLGGGGGWSGLREVRKARRDLFLAGRSVAVGRAEGGVVVKGREGWRGVREGGLGGRIVVVIA